MYPADAPPYEPEEHQGRETGKKPVFIRQEEGNGAGMPARRTQARDAIVHTRVNVNTAGPRPGRTKTPLF